MSCLETSLPPVSYAEVNGIRMAYYEAGPRTGAPVVLCHGFPELAYSWRHQIAALAAAGRWVIAPDQRGYGMTSRPEAVEDYDIEHLTGDLVALLDHLKAPKAIFCGHDWGGFVVWQMPLRHADRVAGVMALNTPFNARAPADPIEIMRKVFGPEMYMVQFQPPEIADAILAKDVSRTMNMFLRRPLPDAPPAVGGMTRGADGESAFNLLRAIGDYDKANDPRPGFLSDDEMACFIETFERTGFTGGINWYRNISRNWRRSEGIADHVAAPALMVMAEKDAVLPPSAAEGMEAFVPDLEKVLIKDSGHWTQQEQPQAVNAVLLDWLNRRFPI